MSQSDFQRQFLEACDVADRIRQPLDVRAKVRTQAGRQVLVGRCPKCGTVAALSGEGKHLCRGCRAWLRYRRDS